MSHKLGLPKPSPAPFNLKMANGTIAKPIGLLRDVKIHIHGIPYIVTLTIIDCQTIKSDYSMLLGRLWLRNAKVIHDWANDQVQIMGNGTVKTVKINRQLGYEAVTPHALVCYNFAEGITDDEETILLAADPTLQPVGTIDWDVLSSQLPTSADDQTNTPDRLFLHSLGTIPVDETPIRDKVKTMDVAYWRHNEQDKLQLLNLGTAEDPKLIRMNANLNIQLTTDATSLFTEYRDVFAFSYEDLQGVPEHIATHRIELETAISPCHQAWYRMNPNYAKAVKEDLEKLLKAGFIEPVDRATWLSLIVVVPKKNGKLRICVDFRRLNAATKKDPYPLPFTDEVLDTVIGYAAYSFIDCFSGYHQVHIHADDRYKTAFITEWGAYVWVVMPFGLKNAPPTYQRINNQIFKDYLNDFMKLFLDDFSVYSDVATHLPKLHLVFERCRQYGVSLNPDKCIFYIPSDVILGYIVCQVSKFPDPKKIEALVNMPPPKNVKAIQTFNGLAQFNRCFIKDYAGIMEPITRLTRKGEVFDWTTECKNAYEYIKTRYQNAPIVIGVDWKLEFQVHTNASDIAIGAMLAKNPTGKTNQPIAYASRLLSKAEKNYTTTEKEALAMVYAVNKFRHYLLGNRFIFYVDHLALQYLVNKPQVSGRLAWWLLLFLEFDFKVIYKPGKTHGVADALSRNEGAEPATGIPDQTTDAQLLSMQPDWIHPIIEYLQTSTFPPSMTKETRKCLAYRAIPFQLVQGKLYQQGKDSRLRQVISDSQAQMILQELHKGNSDGHFSQDITVRKVLDARYWWPTLYKNTYQYCQTCHECQKTRGLLKSVSTKLITTLSAEPFMKWELDFVGPVKNT